jgi:hypothetical protein
MILRKGYRVPAADIISYLHWGTVPLHIINCHSVRYRHSVHAVGRRMNEIERTAFYFSLEDREARWGAPKGGGGCAQKRPQGSFQTSKPVFFGVPGLVYTVETERTAYSLLLGLHAYKGRGSRCLYTVKIIVLSFFEHIF